MVIGQTFHAHLMENNININKTMRGHYTNICYIPNGHLIEATPHKNK